MNSSIWFCSFMLHPSVELAHSVLYSFHFNATVIDH